MNPISIQKILFFHFEKIKLIGKKIIANKPLYTFVIEISEGIKADLMAVRNG